MSDQPTQNAGVESSPAPVFEVPDGPAYNEWRKTGALPSAESAPATTKKSSDTKPAAAGEGEGDGRAPEAADSEPKENSGKKQPSKAERRLNELLDDLREAGLSPGELKSFKAQYQKVQSGEPADKKPAAEPTDKPQGLKAPVKPKESDFKTYEEYEAAKDQYLEDMADYKAAKRFEDYQAKQREEATQKEMRERLEAAKARYGDDAADETIVSAAKGIFNGDAVPAVIKEVLNESSVLVDVLYALGKDSEQLAEFLSLAKSNPGAAMRKAILVEKFVMEELERGGGKRVTTEPEASDKGASPERDSTGKFIKQATPEKKTTSAPPPPKTVSGRSSAPPDEVADAVSAGDFNTYRDAANRKDLNRRLGR